MRLAAKQALFYSLFACVVVVGAVLWLRRPTRTVTFNKDIAPIVFENCAPCHRPDESAPFSLLSYPDARRHARQMAEVTESRFMPPWLPEPGYGEFVGQRRLREEQIRLIRAWVRQGAPQGDPADLPVTPKFMRGWQLGQPDLIIKMPQPYVLQAEGTDVFRNFVFPIPVRKTRYVKAVELRPGNKRIVHHTSVLVDRTRSSRRLDAQDPEPGFGGMEIELESEYFDPHSHFLFWKPGTAPYAGTDNMSWRLDRGTDLVVNMHLQPSGKPEKIQPSVGLYFSDEKPTKFPMLLQLERDGALDIPPGEKDFLVTDHFKLPLDVDVLGVYPHLHYLGKEVQGFATLPDGTKKWLIWIKQWDFNWQAVYRHTRPIFLPKGSIISMRFTYDNSADNVQNPNQPPKRVTVGNRSEDEMAHLWVQVLPRGSGDQRVVLQEALMRRRLEKYPDDFVAHFNLGAALQAMGKLGEAIRHFRQALQAKPNNVTAHNNLGAALQKMGKLEEAIRHYRQAVRAQPDYANAHYNLGNSLLAQGKLAEAIPHFRQVVRINPEDVVARNNLGAALQATGRLEEAIRHFRQVLRIRPAYANAHHNLANALLSQGKLEEAIRHFRQALRIKPNDADIHSDLGSAFAGQGNLVQAVAHYERALRINPEHPIARKNLKWARAQLEKTE